MARDSLISKKVKAGELEVGELVSLAGPWPWGVALAMHSADDEAEGVTRSEVGALLSRFKYGGERRLAGVLGRGVAEAVRSQEEGARLDLVTHVPCARGRARFEPACELAVVVARALRVRCLPRLIARTRKIARQKDLTRWEEKRRNVEGAFRVRRADLVRGRKVLLVDDVYDSGATLEEAWRALTDAGAREVTVIAVTKTRYRRDGG